MTEGTKRPDVGELPLDLFKEFIAAQLSKRDDDADETDRVIIHADCGFGEAS